MARRVEHAYIVSEQVDRVVLRLLVTLVVVGGISMVLIQVFRVVVER